MARVVVIGAGAMGLAAGYRAAKDGHEVDVMEAAPEPGGMAGHFDFGGLSLERFYHFVCLSDLPTFELMKELGIADKMVWRHTTMGYFDGKLHSWGDPISLLKYPSLTLLEKMRYGLFALVCVRRNRWDAIEQESAKSWLMRWCGPSIYDRFWKPLFDYKFYEYADNVSATWIWTRIRRIGRSRKSMLEERLGYIDGGTITLVNALMEGIKAHGGRVHLGTPAERVLVADGHVTGVQTKQGTIAADAVICTAPTPMVNDLVPELPEEWKQKYAAIHNIGVICVIFKLARAVTPHFWVNISVPGIEIPGIIEFSNLRSMGGDAVVYVPYYMPVTHEKFSWTDEQLLSEAFACLQQVNPALGADDVKGTKVARLRYGQPICEPGFAAKIPPVKTPIAGLQIADTCYYYPEDRGIAESVRLGASMARSVGADG
ncbi:MAG: NAD(P)/FAD-dependent oxidoreductase [Acidobacteriaceae bacterium]